MAQRKKVKTVRKNIITPVFKDLKAKKTRELTLPFERKRVGTKNVRTPRVIEDKDILKYVKKLAIPKFRGVFMRYKLPKRAYHDECGIVNLDDATNSGTHWCAYVKSCKNVLYYDSFGDMPPPKNIINYFKNCFIHYNYNKQQDFSTRDCGKLCLEFLNSYKLN